MSGKSAIKLFKNVVDAQFVYDMLPLADILEDAKTIATKGKSVVQVIKIDGMDYTGMAREEKIALGNTRKTIFDSLPKEVKLTVHYQRKRVDFNEPLYRSENKFADMITEKRRGEFRYTYKTEIYLVVTLPYAGFFSAAGVSSFGYTAESEKLQQQSYKLTEYVDEICASLQDYKATVLHHTDDGHSPLLEFWSYIINGASQDKAIPKQSRHIDSLLSCSVIDFTQGHNSSFVRQIKDSFRKVPLPRKDKKSAKDNLKGLETRVISIFREAFSQTSRPYGIFSDNSGKRYSAFLFIRYYPQETNLELLDELMSIQHRFNVVQHFKRLDREEEIAKITTKMDRQATTSRLNVSNILELNELAQDYKQEKFELFTHALSICVYGDTEEEVEEGIAKITGTLVKRSINVVRETKLTEAAFWSMFPDYEEFLLPRKVKITSVSAADFCNFGTKHQGFERNSWGNMPLSVYKTPDGSRYALNLHVDPEPFSPGHTLVVGNTGSGKSVWLSFIMQSALKYMGENGEDPLKMLVFDSMNGLKVPVNAFGGSYMDLAEDSLKLNPMQLEDDYANRRFLTEWLQMITHSDLEADLSLIKNMVTTNFDTLKPEERSLHALRNTAGVRRIDKESKKGNFAERLKVWLPDPEDPTFSSEPYGLMFNATDDALHFNKRIVAFDMDTVLRNDELLGPLTSYIFHSFMRFTEKNPCPHLLIMDEAIKYVNNKHFYPIIQKGLLEFRKRNGVIMAAIQDLGLLMDIKNGEDFVKSFNSYILFPNPSATEQYYMGDSTKAGIGLTKAEYNWLKNSERNRQFMLKRKDGGSVILNGDLSDLGKLLHLLRGDKNVLMAFEQYFNMSDGDLKEIGFDSWQEALMEKLS